MAPINGVDLCRLALVGAGFLSFSRSYSQAAEAMTTSVAVVVGRLASTSRAL